MKYAISKARAALVEEVWESRSPDLYFAARAMSLGSFSRGNADFGRSALNVLALIGWGGETGGRRYRVGQKNATAATGACGRLCASPIFRFLVLFKCYIKTLET